ncbi:Mechanosensitive ion channel protein 10 [Dictyocoela muelleri]|nr:Mechanosensitive ion channel protein 10 [Dictyocoela muelleri]
MKTIITLAAAAEFFLISAFIFFEDNQYALALPTIISAFVFIFLFRLEFQKQKYPTFIRILSRIVKLHICFLILFITNKFFEITYSSLLIVAMFLSFIADILRSIFYENVHNRFYENLLLGYQNDILRLEKYLRYSLREINRNQILECDSDIDWFVSQEIYRYDPKIIFKLWRNNFNGPQECQFDDNDDNEFEDAKIPGSVSIDSLRKHFPIEDAIWIYNILSFGTQEKLTYTTFHLFFRQINNERINLYKSIVNYNRLLKKVNKIFIAIEIIVISFIVYLFYSPNMKPFRIPTFVAFTLFPSIRKFGDSFIFILLGNPYNCGDRIVYDDDNMLVREINILSTVCEKWNGQVLIIPNHLIRKSTILNWRRSKSQTIILDLVISSNTSEDTFRRLSDELTDYCKIKPHFISLKLHVDSIADCNKFVLKLYICHKFNFQNGFCRWFRHTSFIKDLFRILKKYKIKYYPLELPIFVENRRVFLHEMGINKE